VNGALGGGMAHRRGGDAAWASAGNRQRRAAESSMGVAAFRQQTAAVMGGARSAETSADAGGRYRAAMFMLA